MTQQPQPSIEMHKSFKIYTTLCGCYFGFGLSCGRDSVLWDPLQTEKRPILTELKDGNGPRELALVCQHSDVHLRGLCLGFSKCYMILCVTYAVTEGDITSHVCIHNNKVSCGRVLLPPYGPPHSFGVELQRPLQASFALNLHDGETALHHLDETNTVADGQASIGEHAETNVHKV